MKTSASEEERLRKAGKAVNEQMELFRTKHGKDDIQDLLAMVAIVAMTEKLKMDDRGAHVQRTVADKITYLEKLITSSL